MILANRTNNLLCVQLWPQIFETWLGRRCLCNKMVGPGITFAVLRPVAPESQMLITNGPLLFPSCILTVGNSNCAIVKTNLAIVILVLIWKRSQWLTTHKIGIFYLSPRADCCCCIVCRQGVMFTLQQGQGVKVRRGYAILVISESRKAEVTNCSAKQ